MAMLLFILALLTALAADLGSRLAERRARERYRELVGEEAASSDRDDVWSDVRPLVASWGCLATLLGFLRGLGVTMALGAGLYLLGSQ